VHRLRVASFTWIILGMMVAACGPSSTPGASSSAPPAPAAPKRFEVAIIVDPVVVFPGIDQRQASSIAELQDLVNGGLSQVDPDRVLFTQLAEALPTTENGLWKVSADGKMETTWRIRNGAAWHDGTPFTSTDLLFSLQVYQDKDLPYFSNIVYSYIEGADAVDQQTITVRWNRTYIEADGLFGNVGTPMPKHLVEATYTQNKAGLLEMPLWSTEHVGNGPYKVQQFERGSHAVLQAFDGYVLGRPKIDTIVMRFIRDQNTVAANLLAGAVEATMGRGLSVEQAVTIRNQWPEGRIADLVYQSWVRILPQFINPNPAVLLELPFRQALLHAIDRQSIVDTIQEGVGAVAEMTPSIGSPYYAALAPSMVRYEYDPRKSAALLEGLGYTRGGDGGLVDRSGNKLSVEIRTTQDNQARVRSLLVVADDWQKVGVSVQQSITPAQLQGDRAYRQERPGFEINRNGAQLNTISAYHSRGILTAENNYRGVGPLNYPRYGNPELDALTDRFERTIPMAERLNVAGQIINHLTSRVVIMGLYYDVEPAMVSNRLVNFNGYVFDAHKWDVKS
jgi:peptide/nickel transport system substrate-binding protein